MFSEVKTEQRERARTIRREEGAPIKEIARRLGVAASSVSRWVRISSSLRGNSKNCSVGTRRTTGNSAARPSRLRTVGRNESLTNKQVGALRFKATAAMWRAACSIGRKARRIGMRCGSTTRIPRWCVFSSLPEDAFRSAGRGDQSNIEPKLLNLTLSLNVIGEQVALESSRASSEPSSSTPVSNERPGWNRSPWPKRARKTVTTES